MPFNITDFRARLTGDGARPNLFEVRMAFPALAGGTSDSTLLTFTCRAAQLPGSSIGPVIVPYFGREVKLAGNRTFPDWTITIINDENFKVRNAFERWMQGINSNFANRRSSLFATASSYSRPATVIQYGKRGEIIKNYQLVGSFPIDISPIDLDWGANDTIEEYAVTLQYQYWLSDTTTPRSSTVSVPAAPTETSAPTG
jgi:hypothetical protein